MILENKGRVKKDILLLGRCFTINRTLLVPADPESAKRLLELEGVGGIYPLDQKLGIDKAPFKATYKMVAEIAWEGISCGSYKEAARCISKANGYTISHTQVKAVTDYVGKLVYADDRRQAEEARSCGEEKFDRRRERNDVFYAQFDGSYYLENKEDAPGCEWKECKIGICFKESDVCYWANTTEVKRKDIVGYIGKSEEFKYYLIAMLKRNGFYQCKTKIFITDGAKWILPFLQETFPGCTFILDKYHAKKNAGKFAMAVKRGKKQKEAYAEQLYALIDNGDTKELLKALEPYKSFKREGVVQFYDYVEQLKDCMHYDEYEKNGWYDGSGHIESTHRYTMQDRMKRPGQHWNRENGQGILSMKARKECGKWPEVIELIRQDYIRLRCENSNQVSKE